MSALPKQVRDQVDKANEIAEAIKNAQNDPENPPQDPPADPPADPPKDPEPPADPPKDPEPPADPPKDPEPAPAPEPEPTPEDKAEHKYKVLQGKYNAEVPALKKRADNAEAENAELRQRLLNVEGMLASINHTRSEPPPPKEPDLPLITDEEREQFGPDLIDLVERVAKRSVLPEVDDRLGSVSKTVEQVGQKVAHAETSVAESKYQRMISDLAAAIPDWEQQNVDEGFLNWLKQKAPFQSATREQLLAHALRTNDSVSVIEIFAGYRSENAAAASAATPEPAPEPTPEPQPKLDDYVAPGTPKTGTASAPTDSGKRQWSQQDIARLYAEKNEFVKKGKPIPERLQELEKDLFAAQTEGRLV